MRKSSCVTLLCLVALFVCNGCKKKQEVGNTNSVAFPVTIGKVTTQDVPIYIDTIGHLQSPNSVQLISQVNGQIIEILFREGQLVKKGDLLVRIDPNPYLAQIKVAEGNILKDQAALKFAQIQLKSYEALIPQRFVSEIDIAQYKANVTEAEGALLADQGNLDAAKVSLGFTEIHAPIDGVVGLLQVTVGNVFNLSYSNPYIATIQQIHPLAAILTLPEVFFDTLQRHQANGPLKVTLSFANPNQPQMEGELFAIDNIVNSQTGTINLKAIIDNYEGTGWPGQFVRGKILLKVEKGAVVVPTAAVQVGQKGKFVYLLDEKNSTVSVQNITTGKSTDDWTQVISGVKAGDTVITKGQLNLFPGAKVTLPVEGHQ